MKPKIEIIKKEIDDRHYYFVNGEFYPGVTTILDEAAPTPYALKKFLMDNTAEGAEEIKNTAGDFGTRMHDAYEKLLNGIELDLLNEYKTTKEKKHLFSFYEWYNTYKPTEIKTEFVIASIKHKVAGTLDLRCKIGEKNVIIDFKTSSGIYYNHELQLAAYKELYEEMTGEKIDEVYVLRTGTKHKAGYEYKLIERPFIEFQNVYNTYLSLHDGKIPEPPLMSVYPDTLKLDLEVAK